MAGFAPDADEDSDVEFKDEDASDDDFEAGTPSKKAVPVCKKQKYNQKKGLKPNPNGRVVGRKLVMWHRKYSQFHISVKQLQPKHVQGTSALTILRPL